MPTKSQHQQHIDDITQTLQRLDAAGRGVSDRVNRIEPVVGDLVAAIQHVGSKVDQVESATNQLSQICQAVVNHSNVGSQASSQNLKMLNSKIKRLERDAWMMLALIFVIMVGTGWMILDLQARMQRLDPIGQVSK